MTVADIEKRTDKRLANLAPFKPGECGKHRHSKRYVELHDKFNAELGDLNAVDAALLSQAITLICRAERPGTPANDVVRCANSAARIVDRIRASIRERKENAPIPSLQELGLA